MFLRKYWSLLTLAATAFISGIKLWNLNAFYRISFITYFHNSPRWKPCWRGYLEKCANGDQIWLQKRKFALRQSNRFTTATITITFRILKKYSDYELLLSIQSICDRPYNQCEIICSKPVNVFVLGLIWTGPLRLFLFNIPDESEYGATLMPTFSLLFTCLRRKTGSSQNLLFLFVLCNIYFWPVLVYLKEYSFIGFRIREIFDKSLNEPAISPLRLSYWPRVHISDFLAKREVTLLFLAKRSSSMLMWGW